MAITVDVDIGGTFTDGFITRDGEIISVKVDSTPHDLTECFVACLEAGAQALGLTLKGILPQTSVIRFSTTFTTNTLIEHRGPPLGLLVTETYEQSLYNPTGKNSAFASILASEMVRGIPVQVSSSGQVDGEVDSDHVRKVVTELLDLGARSLVVSIKGAHLNPDPEQMIRQIVRTKYPRHYLGAIPILIATEISKSRDDEVRTHSGLMSAYCHHGLARHLYKAEEEIRRRGYIKPLLVVHSNGSTARIAKTVALHCYNSGPAAGSFGCREASQDLGVDPALAMDIGGTSTDLSVIRDATLGMQETVELDGLTIDMPAAEIMSIGGGGGSIARVDNGAIKVGPESAGALPGPMCYGLGGDKPTVTDANLLLGYLNPQNFAGGRRSLDPARAKSGIKDQIADPLGISETQAARQIRDTIDASISEQLRRYASSKGIAVDQAVLFAFGGGGPTQAAAIADLLEIPRVYCFKVSPVFSAYGSSLMDVSHFYQRSVNFALGKTNGTVDLGAIVADMKHEAQRDMLGEGFNPNDVSYSIEGGVSLIKDPRHRVFIEVNAAADTFQCAELGELACRELSAKGISVTLDNLVWDTVRLRATAAVSHPALPQPDFRENQSAAQPASTQRQVFVDDDFKQVPVYTATEISPGEFVTGPAVIEDEYTTIIVSHRRRATMDTAHNIVMEWQ
jgi:N-methylhydantoinase A/acetophenone carboxylase